MGIEFIADVELEDAEDTCEAIMPIEWEDWYEFHNARAE